MFVTHVVEARPLLKQVPMIEILDIKPWASQKLQIFLLCVPLPPDVTKHCWLAYPLTTIALNAFKEAD